MNYFLYFFEGGCFLKILKQIFIILIITFLGELISKTLSLPIPGNVLGMLLLLIALLTRVIKPEHIEEVSNYLLNNLAFFFVPASIGIMGCVDVLKGNVTKLLIICFISTCIVLVVTAHTVQFVSKLMNKKQS